MMQLYPSVGQVFDFCNTHRFQAIEKNQNQRTTGFHEFFFGKDWMPCRQLFEFIQN
jgi:hypothetical protein